MKKLQSEQHMGSERDMADAGMTPAGKASREALSALLDGELSDFELRRLLQQLPQDEALLQTWQRYNLARSALQGEPFRKASEDFSARVAAQIAQEPAHRAGERLAARGSWLVLGGKLAVAASVTAAVFLGMQYTLLQEAPVAGLADTAAEQQPAALASTPSIEVDAEAQRRLNEYIQSVSIPLRSEPAVLEGGSVLDSPLVRPVSDRELIRVEERR